MKLKDGLILREVAGQYVIVPTGKRVQEVTSIIYMTRPAAYLWDYMQKNDFEKADLVKMILEKYSDATYEQVDKDLEIFLKGLADKGVLEIEGQIQGSFNVCLPKSENE